MRPSEIDDALESAFDLNDLEGDEKSGRAAVVELRNVSFTYPTRDVPVLRGLNMKVEGNPVKIRRENVLTISTDQARTDGSNRRTFWLWEDEYNFTA